MRLHQVRVAGLGSCRSGFVAVLVACGCGVLGLLALPGRTPCDHESTRLAYALSDRVPRASWCSGLPVPRLAFPSLDWGRARGRALGPTSVDQGRDDAAGPGEVAPVESPPLAPQSKPVTLAPRLVARIAPLVAVGLGLRILAAGPAPISTVLRLWALCEPTQKFVAMNQGARPRRWPIVVKPKLSVTRPGKGVWSL